MVNTNFYSTINELVNRASNGTVDEVVDYASFIDAGRKLTALSGNDLANNFVSELMNKIALSINTARAYTGKYKDLVKGTLDYGNTIEVIMNYFYDSQAAAFINLPDEASIDQYEIHKPKADVTYFVDSNAYTITRTISYKELKKAFTAPAAMDSFIQGIMTYVLNSNELARETGRINLVASLIVDLTGKEAATSADTPAQNYPLVTMYNELAGTQLTAEDALYNEAFVKYAVQTIKKVMGKTEIPSESYNSAGIKTFTPAESRHLYISSQLSAAMDTYIRTDNYRPEYSILTNYVDVPFWQNEKTPLVISSKGSGDEEVSTAPVIGALFDFYTLGEWVVHEQMNTSPFNARGEYWNTFLNVEVRYLKNNSATAVVFTLA